MYSSNFNNTTETVLFPDLPATYASFWERFAAAFIDGLILVIPSFAIQYLFGRGPSFLINMAIGWLYSALQESGPQQATIGKKALGLNVTTIDGHQLSFSQATGRFFGKYISTIILLIGYLMMIWDERKQTLHDKMAGALVVKQTPNSI